ncbi:hypothetical protein [Stella sp.]|uniref:hypothetical protein n=1 Tax=Stella sp. TaxID=2912054 RepID=UPI0035B0FD1A
MVRLNRWLCLAAVLVTTGCISFDSSTGSSTPGPQTAALVPPAPPPPPAPTPVKAVPSVGTKDLPSKACLNEQDRRNDLLVRLQTEMSVTGLTCQWKAEKGKNLLDQYATFSRKHHRRLLTTQEEHGRFLARYEKGSAPRLFDRYRTILANEEMAVAGRYGHPDYCAHRYQRFTEVVALPDGKALDNWLDAQGKTRAREYKACK